MAILLAIVVAIGGVALFMFFAMVVVWFLRRRGAVEEPAPKKRKGKIDPEASTVIREGKAAPSKESKASPAPLTPAAAVRSPAGAAAGGAAVSPLAAPAGPSGFLAPPPPPPFKAAGGATPSSAPAKPAKPGPLLGFFDEERPQGDEAKTELFSKDMAARYAAMLDDDDDEGEHTELFSAANMDAEMAAALFDDETGPQKSSLPGKVVATDKK